MNATGWFDGFASREFAVNGETALALRAFFTGAG